MIPTKVVTPMHYIYVIFALAGWTIWAVLSGYLSTKANPWVIVFCQGFISLAISLLMLARKPATIEWMSFSNLALLSVAVVSSAFAGYMFYLALGKLPPSFVIPVTQSYLVLAPFLLALYKKRLPTSVELIGLVLVSAGIIVFLIGNNSAAK